MAGQAKLYKRSWKNLLINKRYQLRFTLFMVGLSALLMAGLGVWVMRVATSSNAVASNNLYGAMEVECKDPRHPEAMRPPPTEAPPPAPVPPAQPVAGERERTKAIVTIDETMMPPEVARPPEAPVAPARVDPAEVSRYTACRQKYADGVAELGKRKDHIVYALFATGLLLMVGLTVYGIKMTHKVAGPLHKVSLYLDKLRDGIYDPVYNLRKGDHLGEFYEHFKLAHAGVRKMQEDDLIRLKAALEAADQASLAARSPELAAAIAELRAIVAKKEKSLV